MLSKNKRSKSLFILIVGSFWVAYVTAAIGMFYYETCDLVGAIVKKQQMQMIYVGDNQIPQLIRKDIDRISQNLMRAKNLGLIEFYILQDGSDVVLSSADNNTVGALNYDYKIFNQVMETKKISFRTVKIEGYRLTVGVFQNSKDLILQNFKDRSGPIISDIVMVTLLISAIAYLFLKDIIDLTKVLSSRDRKKMHQLKAVSKEAQTLLQASKSYEVTKKTLEYENKIYTDSLTPAIVHEMKSGRRAPYSFQTSMIRVDLNGYTQIFLDKKDEYVTEMMNTYFVRAREIIERYDGLIYQYVGDEIVFHIKEDNVDSQALATACLRSIFEVAQDIEDHLPAGADHYFKVKGSFVLGKIRFVPQDSGFALSGLPLIESARLISQVEEKKNSSITFFNTMAEHVTPLAKIDQTKEITLKGFAEATSLSRATEFRNVADILADNQTHLLTYFRSDRDLVEIYKHLNTVLKKDDEPGFFKIFSILKHVKVRFTTHEQVAAFEELFAIAITLNSEKKSSDKILASIISLCSNLIPTSFVENSFLELLTKCLDHADARTQANAIIVLGDLAKDTRFLRKYIYAEHNRVSADALLVSGKENFDKELAKKLHEFLESKNPLFKASGAFVVKHLADHYRAVDPVFYETNSELKSLLKKIA